jgi:hypothetical protein
MVAKLVAGVTYHAIATTNSNNGKNKICVWANSQNNPQTFPFTFLNNTPTGSENYGNGEKSYNVLLWDRGDYDTYVTRRRYIDASFQDDEIMIPQVAEIRPLTATTLQLIDCYGNPITALTAADIDVSVTVNDSNASVEVGSVSNLGVITLIFTPSNPPAGSRITYNVTVSGDVIITDPATFIVAA